MSIVCSFSFGATTEVATDKLNIDFVSRAEGTVQYNTGGKVNCLIRLQNNNAVFISKDTVPLGSGNNACSEVVNKTYVYKATYDTCRPISTSSGTAYSCESQPVDLVVSLNGDLYLPVIKSFTGKTATSSGSCYSPAQFLNVFNSDLQKSLGATDTVVVQQKRWKLRKL